MKLQRRELLIGAIAGTTAFGIFGPRTADAAVPLLFLHDGSADAAACHRRLTRTAAQVGIRAERIAILAPGGFARVHALLDHAGDARLVALVDTGSAIALETMLQARGATLIGRTQPNAGVTLLGALVRRTA